jgi:hypothetical protein
MAKMFEQMVQTFLKPTTKPDGTVDFNAVFGDMLNRQMSYREGEWIIFSERVRQHIIDYTVPQFGDFPEDQITEWNTADCVKAIQKYAARFGKGARGPEEQKRDFLKMAHYACMGLAKLEQEGLG